VPEGFYANYAKERAFLGDAVGKSDASTAKHTKEAKAAESSLWLDSNLASVTCHLPAVP
jgi:hypothetical protein